MDSQVNGRKRKLLIGGGVLAVCGAIAISGVLTANAQSAPDTYQKVTDGKPAENNAPGAYRKLGEAPAAPAPDAYQANPAPEPFGAVISTGIKDNAGELVFYGVKVNEPSLPQTHFGVMAGHRTPGGKLTADYTANEFDGPDKAPGFHAVSLGANGVPSFGYYAGPVDKITAKIDGKTVQAHQARWSEDPQVVFFWFDSAAEPSGLAAFDAAGKALPLGHSEVGRG